MVKALKVGSYPKMPSWMVFLLADKLCCLGFPPTWVTFYGGEKKGMLAIGFSLPGYTLSAIGRQ